MVVVILRNLGAAAAGVGAVAVEFGFGEEAGAGAGEDAAMPFSRRALTAAMPRALTPLLAVIVLFNTPGAHKLVWPLEIGSVVRRRRCHKNANPSG